MRKCNKNSSTTGANFKTADIVVFSSLHLKNFVRTLERNESEKKIYVIFLSIFYCLFNLL